MKKTPVWQILLFGAIAAILMYFSFRGIKWTDFKTALQGVRWEWVVATIIVGISALYVRAVRWRLLLLPMDPAIKRRYVFDAVNLTYLTNFALPRAGELARAGVVATTSQVTFNKAFGTVVAERTWDILCTLICCLGVVMLNWNVFGKFMGEYLWTPLVNRIGGGSAWRLLLVVAGSLFFLWLLLRIFRKSLSNSKIWKKITGFCKGIGQGMITCLQMPHKGRFLWLSVLLWTTYAFTSYFTILAFPSTGLHFQDALFLMVVGSFGWAVPVQGGFGSFHFIVSLALTSVYGFSQTQGIAYATLAHETQALVMLICGIYSLIRMSFYKRRHPRQK